MRVQCLDPFNRAVIAAVRRRDLRVDYGVIGKNNVIGRKLYPVMPQDAFSQMKDDLQSVRRDVPGFGKVSGYLYVFVVFCQPVVNPAADIP